MANYAQYHFTNCLEKYMLYFGAKLHMQNVESECYLCNLLYIRKIHVITKDTGNSVL